jgi:hypothetical protein
LRHYGSAIFQLLLTTTIVGLLFSVPWWFIELFLIPKMVRDFNKRLAAKLGA